MVERLKKPEVDLHLDRSVRNVIDIVSGGKAKKDNFVEELFVPADVLNDPYNLGDPQSNRARGRLVHAHHGLSVVSFNHARNSLAFGDAMSMVGDEKDEKVARRFVTSLSSPHIVVIGRDFPEDSRQRTLFSGTPADNLLNSADIASLLMREGRHGVMGFGSKDDVLLACATAETRPTEELRLRAERSLRPRVVQRYAAALGNDVSLAMMRSLNLVVYRGKRQIVPGSKVYANTTLQRLF